MKHKCSCNWIQQTLSSGCEVCNPELTIELLREQITDLEAQIVEERHRGQRTVASATSRLLSEIMELKAHSTCGACQYVSVCGWTRGEDDKSCGKFEVKV